MKNELEPVVKYIEEEIKTIDYEINILIERVESIKQTCIKQLQEYKFLTLYTETAIKEIKEQESIIDSKKNSKKNFNGCFETNRL